jgi:hypothetical protein
LLHIGGKFLIRSWVLADLTELHELGDKLKVSEGFINVMSGFVHC